MHCKKTPEWTLNGKEKSCSENEEIIIIIKLINVDEEQTGSLKKEVFKRKASSFSLKIQSK